MIDAAVKIDVNVDFDVDVDAYVGVEVDNGAEEQLIAVFCLSTAPLE